MEYLAAEKETYKDATQKEPKAKRALMDALTEIGNIWKMFEDVKDTKSFEAVFEKAVSKTSALKKSLNRLPEKLSLAKKALDEVATARKKKTEAAATSEVKKIVGSTGGGDSRKSKTSESKSEDPSAPQKSKTKPKSKKEKITKPMREYIWKKYIGNYAECKCPICDDNKIMMTNFTAGHIVAEAVGGPTNRDNLIPICNTCNVRMSVKNPFDYCRKEFGRDPVFPTN